MKQPESPTIKSMTQILPTRSNQDEFSKSNTAPQSAGTEVHDKNTEVKENLKTKVNQKDLPQLITNISATSLKLKNSAQKVLRKQRETKSVKTSHSIYSQARPHLSDRCLCRNKAMSDISDAELYSLITDVYKPPKNLHFPETEWSFRIARLEELPWLYYSW